MDFPCYLRAVIFRKGLNNLLVALTNKNVEEAGEQVVGESASFALEGSGGLTNSNGSCGRLDRASV